MFWFPALILLHMANIFVCCPKEKIKGLKNYDRQHVAPIKATDKITVAFQSTFRLFLLRMERGIGARTYAATNITGAEFYVGKDLADANSSSLGYLQSGSFFGTVTYANGDSYYLMNPRILFCVKSWKAQLKPTVIVIRSKDLEQLGSTDVEMEAAQKERERLNDVAKEALNLPELDFSIPLSPNRVCPTKILFGAEYLAEKERDGYDASTAKFDAKVFASMLITHINFVNMANQDELPILFRAESIGFYEECSGGADLPNMCLNREMELSGRRVASQQLDKLVAHDWSNYCAVLYFENDSGFGQVNGVAKLGTAFSKYPSGLCSPFAEYLDQEKTLNALIINVHGRMQNFFELVHTAVHETDHLAGIMHDPLDLHPLCSPGGEKDLRRNFVDYAIAPDTVINGLRDNVFKRSVCAKKRKNAILFDRIRLDKHFPTLQNCFTLI